MIKQWITKNKKNRPGIILLILLFLFGIVGIFENYYVKNSGVYVTATIIDVDSAPRGYSVFIKYSYKNRQYEKMVSASLELANKKNIGKKLLFSILPNHPTTIAYISYAPNCIGDNPPEGWKEIPKCE